MFQNYLTAALRNFTRNRLYAAINIGGLALGFAAVTLIGLFVRSELQYDTWLPDHDRIYKVEFTETEPGREPFTSAQTSALLAAAMVKDYAGIEEAVRLKSLPVTVQQDDQKFREHIHLVDPNFFSVFDIPVLQGNRDAVLSTGTGIAISERIAKKYYGTVSPLGKTLAFDGAVDLVVTAVFQNLPVNSHFDMDFIAKLDRNLPLSANNAAESWGSGYLHTYIKVKPGFDLSPFTNDQRAFAERNISLNWTKLPPADLHHYNVIPIADIHLYSDKIDHEKPVSDINTVITFAIIAAMILALAAINFTNLSTAQALKRAREIGLRKVLGANRLQLMGQFLGEAVLTAFVAMMLGLATAELVLPVYNNFLDQTLSLDLLGDPAFALSVLAIVFLTGLAGGLYPALVLSNFRPVTTLRSSQAGSAGDPWFRNALVILQFSVSIALMAATSIVYLQTSFIQNTDLGFDPSGKVTIAMQDDRAGPVAGALKERLRRIPGVKTVSATSADLPMSHMGLAVVIPPLGSVDQSFSLSVNWSDPSFFDALGQKPLAGRLFSADRQVDFRTVPEDESLPITRGVVLNEAALKALGFDVAAAAIGQALTLPGNGRETIATVIGVVPDAHLDSLYAAIQPMVFFVSNAPLEYMLLDTEQGNRAGTMSEIEQVWQDMLPGVAMSPSYLEDAYAALYRDAERQGNLFAIFATFAVFVASLGLYGLSAHMAERRTKEIGIRKVVGAHVSDIVALLTWQLSKLVIVAAPVGIIASIWAMQGWLTGFAYRVSLFDNAWVFAVAAVSALIIAWLTVASQAFRVARTNPIKALKHE